MQEKLIFLDFDGVLVRFPSPGKKKRPALADPECVENLNDVVASTGAGIVVTSSWRIGSTLEKLQELVRKWGVVGEVIGKTPNLYPFVGFPRACEVYGFLTASFLDGGGPPPFVIIDDEPDACVSGRLVRTNSLVGLTRLDAGEAIGILNAPQRIQR